MVYFQFVGYVEIIEITLSTYFTRSTTGGAPEAVE